MAIASSDPKVLAQAAKCFACYTPAQQLAIQSYLLAVIAGLPTNAAGVDAIALAAKCFMPSCIPSGYELSIQNYLLSQIAS